MTAPRWLLRAVTKFGLELRTAEDRAKARLADELLLVANEASERAAANLTRAVEAEIRADQAERQLAAIAKRNRDAMALLRGEIEIPAFLPARAIETPRVPRQPELEQVAA